MPLNIAIKGAEDVTKALRNIAAIGEPGSARRHGLMLAIGSAMQTTVGQTFRDQKDPITGQPWKKTGALSLSTRVKGGAGGRTLSDSGALADSLIRSAPKVTANVVSIGTNLVYAELHNEGGTITPVNAEFLAYPLTKEARRAGTARRWWNKNKSLRPFVVMKGEDRGVIATKDGKGIKAHWRLSKSETIDQRRFLGLGPKQAEEYARVVELAVEMAWEGK